MTEDIIQPEEHISNFATILDSAYPLLQKFRKLAPGTYKHCQTVSSMVETISLDLNLDIDFMKVVCLYHDIGKINNPKYFVENELEDENKHKELHPWLSSQIIARHVSDGVNILLNDINFPRKIIEVISQHHGTCTIKYFFNKSKVLSDCIYNEQDFKYKNTKPQSIEAAVLMLTDTIEATTRSLVQAGKYDPTTLIDTTINGLLDDGQLDNVTMQLGDLKKIKKALSKELEGLYQKRVDYGELEEINKNDGKK